MNKLFVAIVGTLIIVGSGTVVIVTRGGDDTDKVAKTATSESQDAQSDSQAKAAVDACDVLTEIAAKAVLGNDVEKGNTSAGSVSTRDVAVSNCVYSTKTATMSTIGVLVRSGKTKVGAESNKTPFTSAKPAGVEDVSGYGELAYFNPQTGQMNILKGGNWYILTYGVGARNTKTTLAELKPLADAIKTNIQ